LAFTKKYRNGIIRFRNTTNLPMNKLNLFEELNPSNLANIIRAQSIVYLPLGTLEWHERHLPFGLDAIVSYKICKELCKRLGGCVIPPLYFGTDREHKIDSKIFHGMDARAERILPGSIYFLKKNLFYNLLVSITKNVSQQGFKKLVIVSAHSGTAQQEVLTQLVQHGTKTLQVFVFPGKRFAGGIDHAAKLETSLMLALRPNLVNVAGVTKPYEGLSGDDPKEASIKEGKRHFQNIVEKIEKCITLGISYLPDDCEKKNLPQGTIYIGHSSKKQSVGFLKLLPNQKLPEHNRPVEEQLKQIKGQCVMELYDEEKLFDKRTLNEGDEMKIPAKQYHVHSNLSSNESLTYWKFDGNITAVIESIRKM